MMVSRIYYSSVSNKVRAFFLKEELKLPRGFFTNMLAFMSSVCSYEEEEAKIKPSIILGVNLDTAMQQVPGLFRLKVSKGRRNGTDIDKRLKSLLPFCNNGWHVYININKDYIEYGIVRAFTGLKGLSVTETLFTTEESVKSHQGFNLVELLALNKFEIKLQGLLGNELVIDSRFVDTIPNDDSFLEMSKDITSCIENSNNKIAIAKVFYNLLKTVSQRVHGTICIVVKNDYEFPNAYISDGVWLEDPIDLSKFSLEHIDNPGEITGEMFYGLSGVFIEMLNHDGITVLDDLGRVRGFNIFINKANLEADDIAGGARKRAAHALLHVQDAKLLGVYFQSQDGNSFYKRG